MSTGTRNGLRWAAITNTGRVRSANEDAFASNDRLFVVADGMGGHLAGEVASEMAVSTLLETLGPNRANRANVDTNLVVSAVQRANGEILAASRASADRYGMGTTITALAVIDAPNGPRLALVNVGDSRAYVLRKSGRFQQLSVDHSYVQELIDTGQLTRSDARFHPQRNIVTRALGIEPNVRIDAWTLPIVQGDRFLLCSDGLVDEVFDETIAELLERVADPQEVASELIATANRHGGRDNITVVIVDVVDGAEPADPTLELELEPHWAEGEGEIDRWSDDMTPTAPWGNPVTPAGGVDATPTNPGPVNEMDERDITRTMALPTVPRRGAPVDDRPVARRSHRSPEAATAAAVRRPQDDVDDGSTDVIGTRELRQIKRPQRSWLNWRSMAFAVGLAAVAVAAFAAIAANARSGYYVGFSGDRVAIYEGREGGMLWFDPTLKEAEGPVRSSLTQEQLVSVEANPTFESLADARVFVANLPSPDTAPIAATTTTPATTLAPTTLPAVAPPPESSTATTP